jgi:enediyne biosynthesis protein E4
MVMGRRRWWLMLALVLVGTTIGAGWIWWQDHHRRHAIAEIEADMAAGRHGIAGRRLIALLASNPGSDQAAYLLGVCELTRGRNRDAELAWERVTPGSSFSSRAISDRLSLLVDAGRLADAESVINKVAEDPRVNRTALRILLVPVFNQQGRLDDAQRLIEERWQHLRETGEEATELAVNLGRLSLELLWNTPPIDTVRADLARAAALAPDDDRVWLGQANLALRTGSLDVAERLLDACLKRRPDDAPVWRARLNWAMAANRADVVRQAMSHLPAGELTPAHADRAQAWLAARQGDRVFERQALESLVASDPGDLAAWKRLAEAARQDGKPEIAAEPEHRQADIARLDDRFHKLFDRNQPIRDAVEMGELAEKLGHTFVAKVFFTVAAATSLHRDDAKRELARLTARPDFEAGH